MYCKISHNIKVVVIWLYEHNFLALDDILDYCGFSEHTWYYILKLWHNTGDIVPPKSSLHGYTLHYLCHLIHQNLDYFLDMLLYLLETNHFIFVNYATIHHELERTNISQKKLKCIALECNEPCQAAFISHMAQYSPEEVGFFNEMSKDDHSALLSLDGIVASMVVEGSMTKALFLKYLEFNVVCWYNYNSNIH
ncbi:hypothetical protein BDZ94DRAFT_1172319 [Collybia nuda]|uniref:Uncharacterized protein n=1 Tax=Collybia nuda TaxID=64659 RepID=A0A9P5XWY1_9AGAR|nr:hypothetical protein BDZ94DRAFT_1172319 [Collybia nuda]